jgi:hypothetical protein
MDSRDWDRCAGASRDARRNPEMPIAQSSHYDLSSVLGCAARITCHGVFSPEIPGKGDCSKSGVRRQRTEPRCFPISNPTELLSSVRTSNSRMTSYVMSKLVPLLCSEPRSVLKPGARTLLPNLQREHPGA